MGENPEEGEKKGRKKDSRKAINQWFGGIPMRGALYSLKQGREFWSSVGHPSIGRRNFC